MNPDQLPPNTVYIGRRARGGWAATKWRNPFKVSNDSSRAEVIAMYRVWLCKPAWPRGCRPARAAGLRSCVLVRAGRLPCRCASGNSERVAASARRDLSALAGGEREMSDDAEHLESRCRDLRRRAELTGNRLYVWEAILHYTVADAPLPDWCIDYIRTVAFNLFDLRHGRDPSKPPVRQEGESERDFAERSNRQGQFTAQSASDRVASALMLTRRGWNAFVEFESDQQKELDASTYDHALEGDADQARARIRSQRNLAHDRSVRRHFQKGLSLLGRNVRTKPTP